MPQQPQDDWVTIGSQKDDWATINPPAQAPQANPSSYLEDWNNLWFNQPLSRKLTVNDTQIFDPAAAANYYDDPAARTEDQWKIPSWVPMVGGGSLRSLGAGMLEGAGNVIEGFTTPLNLATAGTAKTAQSLSNSAAALNAANKAAAAAKKLQQARAATTATRTLSAPVMATGAARIGEGISEGDWMNVGMGIAELSGGAAGVKMPYPNARTPMAVPDANAPAPIDLPLNITEPMIGSREVLPLNRPAPVDPNFAGGAGNPELAGSTPYPAAVSSPEAALPTGPSKRPPILGLPEVNVTDPAFDPSTLVGLQRAEPQFVNPQTGEIRPASQAQPGDVPYLPERSGQGWRPTLGPTNRQMFENSARIGAENKPAPSFEQQVLGNEFQPDIRLDNEPIPELGGTAPRVVTPPDTPAPAQPKTFMDWLNNLAKEESGEFDPDALTRFIRGADEAEAPRNREEFDYHWRDPDGNTYYPFTQIPDNAQYVDGPPPPGSFRGGQARVTPRVEPTQSHSGGEFEFRDITPEAPARDIRYDTASDSYFDRNTPNWDDVFDATPEEIARARGIVEGTVPDPTGSPSSRPSIIARYDEQGGVEQLHDWNTQDLQNFIREVGDTGGRLQQQADYATGIVQERLTRDVDAPPYRSPEGYAGLAEQFQSMTPDEARRYIDEGAEDIYPEDITPLLDELRAGTQTDGSRAAVTHLEELQRNLRREGIRTEPVSAADRRGTNRPYWWQDELPEPEVNRGKSLEEVEATKKQPALERLGKLIGEERAQQLATGDRQIQFSERAERARGKRLARSTVRSWSEWGDAQVKDVHPDPSKPGVHVEGHGLSNMFPNSFEVTFRDPQGNPLGVLRTNLDGTGIDTLAVSSKIGLRRGKVAFAMLKEAFDRGVNEPSGGTSDFTKNLIERVKRLASSESGEFDADVVINAINKFMDTVANSRIGQAVSRFVRGESGEFDLDRLQALFKKQQEGTITPEEVAEATAMAKEYKTAQSAGTAQGVTDSLNQRLTQVPPKQAAPTSPPVHKTTRARGAKPPRPPLVGENQLQHGVPVLRRKPPKPGLEEHPAMQVWNATRSLQSIDLPGITSAALRQSRPLAFTTDWFKAWNTALKTFKSKDALDAVNAKIAQSKYFRPRYQPVLDKTGKVARYIEKPSIAEELGVKMTDVIHHREEAIVSALAEKIPGYGRYVKASNRAYTGFLNDLRAAKFEQLMDGAKALGRDPEVDVVLGKKLADFVNNATGRGSLKYLGDRVNLEPIGDILGAGLYSPRALSARLAFMNPHKYVQADPLVRMEYWKGMARIGASWGAAAGLASLMPGVTVSMDPNSADFGKIRMGNTRFDPGAGFQQLLVMSHKMLPKALGGGGTVSSTGAPGRPGKFTPFGSHNMAATRRSTVANYIYNQMHPSLRYVLDLLGATRKEPFDLTDRTLQAVLPMYVSDIAEAAKTDSTVAEMFAPLLSSMGTGVQTYERGSFNKPQITPFIEQVTGVKVPTVKVGR